MPSADYRRIEKALEVLRHQGLIEWDCDGVAGAVEYTVRPMATPMHANLSVTGREPYHLSEGHLWTRACDAWACRQVLDDHNDNSEPS